jgi:PKD repeat protein
MKKIILLLLLVIVMIDIKAQSISGGEYFFNTAPINGGGTPFSFAISDSVSHSLDIPISSLSPGFHNLYIRVKNTAEKWSHYEGRVFYISPVLSGSSPLVSGEWFVDNDPGIGNGTAIAFAQGDSISLVIDLSTEGIEEGAHQLFIRVKDANGMWSHCEGRTFNICPTPVSCLFNDDFNDGSAAFVSDVNAFSHTETDGSWVISNAGHDEWENWTYTINNGAIAAPIDFSCPSNKPLLKIRARASDNVILRIQMLDANGGTDDNVPGWDLELGTTFQDYAINFQGYFYNLWSCDGGCGVLDSSQISRLAFFVNPGYVSYPITGVNGLYNTSFANGSVYIDWIGIGDPCEVYVPPMANFNANLTTTCPSQSIVFTNTSSNTKESTTYSWDFGTDASPATATGIGPHEVTYSSLGTKTVSLSLDGGTFFETKSDFITVSPNATPSVTISITNGSNPSCQGSEVTYTAVPTGGGTSPSYQWKVGAVNVGTNSSVYTTSTLTDGQVVSCVMSSNANCVSPLTVTSNSDMMTITPTVTTETSIAITSGSNPSCAGSNVAFTATSSGGGLDPAYQWRKNGNLISGETNAIYSTTSLLNNDQVSVTMISNATCPSPANITSEAITMTINPVVVPLVSVDASQTTICAGADVSFFAIPVGGGIGPTYQWKKNGAMISLATNSTYNSNGLANNDQISVTMTSNASCPDPLSVTSQAIIMTVNPIVTPSVSISTDQTIVCPGTDVVFTAAPVHGGTSPVYQWSVNANPISGATSSSYNSSSFADGNQVEVAMTSNASCISSAIAISTPINLTVSESATPVQPGAFVHGPENVNSGSEGIAYEVPNNSSGAYSWSYSGTGVNISGNGNNVLLDFSSNATGGDLSVTITNACGTSLPRTMAIEVSQATEVIRSADNLVSMKIYPNPFASSAIVKIDMPSIAKATVILADVTGQILHYLGQGITLTTGENTLKVPENIASGMYVVKVMTEDMVLSVKCVKLE